MTERNKRVALILAAVFLGGGVICLVCGVFGAVRFQELIGEVQRGAEETNREADEFARTHDQLACRDDGLRRADLCGPTDIACIAQVNVFMDRCLSAATPTAGLCDGVPSQTEIMAGATWAAAQCAQLGRGGDQHCTSLMQSIQRTCAHP